MKKLSVDQVIDLLKRFDDETTGIEGANKLADSALEVFRGGTRRVIVMLESVSENEPRQPLDQQAPATAERSKRPSS